MRKLRITVEGKVYDVLVEVLDEEVSAVPGASDSAPAAPTSGARPSRPPVVAPHPPHQAGRAPSARQSDPNAILAPIAGTVRDVFVTAGAPMEAKARLVLIEAMKMNTYIYAPRPGIAASVEVQVGDAVHVGDCLVRYEPEGGQEK